MASRTLVLLTLLAASSCMYAPADQAVVASWDGFWVYGAVPASTQPELVRIDVATAEVPGPADWSESAVTFPLQDTVDYLGSEWNPYGAYVPIPWGAWFLTPNGFRAQLRARWGNEAPYQDLYSIADHAQLDAAQDLNEAFAATAGTVLTVYAPGACTNPPYCVAPEPGTVPPPGGGPPAPASEAVGCNVATRTGHTGSVAKCLLDADDQPIVCLPSICGDDGMLYEWSCVPVGDGTWTFAGVSSTPCNNCVETTSDGPTHFVDIPGHACLP